VGPSAQGIVRRGLQIDALKEFILSQGASRNVTYQEWEQDLDHQQEAHRPCLPQAHRSAGSGPGPSDNSRCAAGAHGVPACTVRRLLMDLGPGGGVQGEVEILAARTYALHAPKQSAVQTRLLFAFHSCSLI